MKDFLITFVISAIAIAVFLSFGGIGLFYSFLGIVLVAALVVSVFITALLNLSNKNEELTKRIEELEKLLTEKKEQ